MRKLKGIKLGLLFVEPRTIRNKLNENGEVSRSKKSLVCKVYDQEEGIDYGETFSPISRLEGVRTLLAYVAHKRFKLY